MKRVLVFATSEQYAQDPAFRIRILALREAMARRGFDWVVRVRPKMPWGRLALAWSARKYEAVILHRKMLDPYETRALQKGIRPPGRIIMDIDDATMYHETELGMVARRRLDRRFEATVGIVDVVCAGNEYLADIFRKRGRTVRIVPSVVAPENFLVKHHEASGGVRLVWIGSSSTLKYLEEAMGVLGEENGGAASRVKGLSLVVICDRPPASATLPVEFQKWSEETEAGALAMGDIGIAPTPENRWTLGKCGFKIVQYMAAGLPVVASPVGMNVDLVNGGGACGLLPGRWEEWPEAIERLAKNVTLRREMGAAGRKRVEEELCVEKIADIWADVLQ